MYDIVFTGKYWEKIFRKFGKIFDLEKCKQSIENILFGWILILQANMFMIGIHW